MFLITEIPLFPGPPENDRLTVKRELENQDDASAREMYKVLDAVNRGQSRLPPFLISVFLEFLTFPPLPHCQVRVEMAPAVV